MHVKWEIHAKVMCSREEPREAAPTGHRVHRRQHVNPRVDLSVWELPQQAVSVVVHHRKSSWAPEGHKSGYRTRGRELVHQIDRHQRTKAVADDDQLVTLRELLQHPFQDGGPQVRVT